jgi:imidazolonepropionase
MTIRCDLLWHHARLATLVGDGLGEIEDGVIAASNGRILFAGASKDAPSFDPARSENCAGRWITPGLIDCHTHLVYAGDRANDCAASAMNPSPVPAAASCRPCAPPAPPPNRN